MIATLAHYIDLIAKIVEVIGVLIMFFGLFFAFYRGIRLTSGFNHETYIEIRQTVGKYILLGLEGKFPWQRENTVLKKEPHTPKVDEL